MLAIAAMLLATSSPPSAQERQDFQYTEIYSDSQGVSHFRDQHVAWVGRTNGSIPPTLITPATATSRILFMRVPKGQQEDWHPAPAKSFVILLGGMVELEAGDGERRIVEPGSVQLESDTEGRGHRTHVLGDQDATIAFLPLP